MTKDRVVIIDFGSQYTMLIARRIRELNVFSEIVSPFEKNLIEILSSSYTKGIILSGGPMSVYDKDAPLLDKEIFNLGKPILGICYGLQLIAHLFGGKVTSSEKREYGFALFKVNENSELFDGMEKEFRVWMSHGDYVKSLPPNFKATGETEFSPYASIENKDLKIYGVQFHPEVYHTKNGKKIIKNFLFKILKVRKNWKMSNFIKEKIEEIRENVKNEFCFLALSGGVDSSTLAFLLKEALGDRFYPIFVETGLLKENEKERIRRLFSNFRNLNIVEAKDEFLNALKGVTDPEEKRRIIGKVFFDIFEKKARELSKREKGKVGFLAQGTLYPDLIESKSYKGPSSKIKTHHNVGGVPEDHPFFLLEPFKELFKDEVRKIGKKLGVPEEILERHPFPGPGMAIRIIGEVDEEKLEIIKKADLIVEEEIRRFSLYKKLWQVFPVLLPVKSVGVMGDKRTYERVIALRAVKSVDGMTADWARIPYFVLDRIARRIVGEVRGVNRVVYDITSKPPSTIEWE
ncbi:MAG: glutamine-hydrolyzing GMP synthase [Candidatus Hydrothermales bacterium]